MKKPWCRAALLAAIAGIFHAPYVLAIDWGQEYATRLKASQAVSSLGDSAFGDQIDLFDGTVSFSATDISLPGNSALPVALGRSLNPLDHSYGDSGTESPLGDWTIDVPYLAGTYPAQALWLPAARCSTVAAPPAYQSGTFGILPSTFWGGVQLHSTSGDGYLLKMSTDSKLVKPTFADPVKWVTKSGWYFSCLDAPLASGEQSEGFMGHAPDGTKYTFNWMVTYEYPGILRRDYSPGGQLQEDLFVARKQVRLYATEVKDRFGNWVRYDWTGGRLNRIYSNDQRQITLQYHADGRLLTATVPLAAPQVNRVWTYQYVNPSEPVSRRLATVINPDSSKWIYDQTRSISSIHYPNNPATGKPTQDSELFCWLSNAMERVAATYTITSPSGAQALYTFLPTRHGRTNVRYNCNNYDDDPYNDFNLTPLTSDVVSLQSKRVSGPGMPVALYEYSYAGLEGSYAPKDPATDALTHPSPPPHYKYVTVKQPDGSQIVNKFGKDVGLNERQLFQVDVIKNSVLYKRTTHSYVSNEEAPDAAFPDSMGSSLVAYSNGFASSSNRPMKSTTISIPGQGATFTSQVATGCVSGYCLDAWARPTSMVKSSTGLGASYSKTDTTVYKDHLSHWLLGQVESTATNGIVSASTVYDPTTALPLQTKSFGKLQEVMTYNADGTLATVSDGRDTSTFDTTIHLSGWKRGLPTQIQFPAIAPHPAVFMKAGVDDNGWIDWVSNENGYKTCYDQDLMGRTRLVNPPSETTPSTCDVGESSWNATTSTFKADGTAVYGLPANHWRQVVDTGNARKIVHVDELWRPVVEETYSVPVESTTRSVIVKRYDSSGRLVFQSYPMRTLGSYADPNLKGVRTEYDALGRVTASKQDSDNGVVLSTTMQYLADFKTKVTNPLLKSTTTSYIAYGEPSTDLPKAIEHPGGAYTDILRDVFGKPLEIKRRNSDFTELVSRWYVYHPTYQTLCKTIEPETGATVMEFDVAGNLSWSASGLNLPSTSSCNLPEGEAAATRVDRLYDQRSRLTTLSFPDGNGDQDWTYHRDGAPWQVTTWNIPSTGAAPKETVNTYYYNSRGMLKDETVAHPAWYTYSLHYDYNPNGHLSGQSYPSGQNLVYSLNALGQTVGIYSTVEGVPEVTYASDISYYPNGALEKFTYGNTIVHQMWQNDRQLPERSTDSKAGVTALDLGYVYDANGNVGTITDYAQINHNRSMLYDDLDRLIQVTSPIFGTDPVATYTYNTLDNLKRAKVAGRDTYYCYNTKNQLDFLRTGSNCSASPAHTYLAYDDQGNLESKDAALGVNLDFDFDTGNRLREVRSDGVALERYRYDAHGRRTLASRLIGPADSLGVIFSQYAQGGPLMYQENMRPGVNKEIDYIYLAGSLIAQREASLASGAVTVRYQHTDALGSPVAITNESGGLLERVDYEPYGKVLGAGAVEDGPGYTGHVLDATTGMNYMQQRYYDPQIGRFLSVDPVTADGNGGGNFNRYWYANNNPYRFTDPDGRAVKEKFREGDRGGAFVSDGMAGTSAGTTMENFVSGGGGSGSISGALCAAPGNSEPRIPLAGNVSELVANTVERVKRRSSVSADVTVAGVLGANLTASKTPSGQADKVSADAVVGMGLYRGVSYNFRLFSWGEEGSTGGRLQVDPSSYLQVKVGALGSLGMDVNLNDAGGGDLSVNFGIGTGGKVIYKPPTTLSYEKEL